MVVAKRKKAKVRAKRKGLRLRAMLQGKPSIALEAMCDGLEKFDEAKGFVINMSTYGAVYKKVCYGCAATCALQQLAGVVFTPSTIYDRHKAAGVVNGTALQAKADAMEFERAMNSARRGALLDLWKFCGMRIDVPPHRRWRPLLNHTWRDELPRVRQFVAMLKAKGM